MANDPNKQQPNDDAPDSGDDESALPPWLRGDAPPPVEPPAPSSIPRLAPRQPAPGDDDPSVPPWLRGMEPPEEKKVVIGGKEVSMDFFDDAESLAQDSNTDLTYDAWLAEQIESRREKSVEEELPDFFTELNASPPTPDAAPDQPSAYPIRDVTGGTSQLPDWFLGLDEIDDSDAPDWVRQIGGDSSPQLEPEPDPTPAITDFFQDMGLPVEEDSFSDLNLPDGAFFSELVGKPAADDDDLPVFGAADAPIAGGVTRRLDDDDPFADFDLGAADAPIAGGATRRLDDDDPFADFDLGAADAPVAGGATRRFDDDDPFADFDAHADTPTMPSPPQAVDIPQIELDAFLDGLDGMETITSPPPPAASAFPDIEDPDLDLFMPPSPPPAPEPAQAQAEPVITEDDLNWLDELEGIVSSVTRGDAPAARSAAEMPASFDDMPAFEIEPLPEPGATPIEFDWDESPVTPTDKLYVPTEPEPASTQELDWLNSIDADDSAHQSPTTQVPPEELERLGLLRALDPQPPRPAQPQPEPASNEDDFASLYADPFADNDDPFAAAGLEAIDFGDESPTPSPDTSGIHIDAGTLERLNALSGYAPDESAVFDAELRSGWMDDALLDEAALIDSAMLDSSLDMGTPTPHRQVSPDSLDMLREPEQPTPIRTTFDPEIGEDEPSDTIDFGLVDTSAQPAAESGYTPLFGGYGDDDDQPETLDLSMFDEPGDAPAQPVAESGYTPLFGGYGDDDDQPETLDLSLFDEPGDAPAQPVAESTGFTGLLGAFDDDDDQPETLDLSLFDEPGDAPAQPAAESTGFTGLLGAFDDDDDQPETLDLSMFDEPGDAPAQPVAESTGFTGLLGAFDDDDDQPETLDLSLFDEPDDAPAQPAAESGYTPLFGGYGDDDDQPETLDLSMFDEPGDAPAQPAAESGYTPLFGGYGGDDDQPETLDLSLFDEPGNAPAQPAADFSDPHATMPVRDELAFEDDWQPYIPTAEPGQVESAATDDFVDSFSLDDLAPSRPKLSDDLFEVDHILAELDSQSDLAEEDTQEQPPLILDDETSPPDFSFMDADSETDNSDLDSLFGMVSGAAADPLAADWGDAPTADAESPFAMPTLDDSYDAPIPGFGEGLQWAMDDEPATPGGDAQQIEDFLADRSPFTLDDAPSPPKAPPAPAPKPAAPPVFEDLDTYLESIDIDLSAPGQGQMTGALFNDPGRLDIDAMLDREVVPGEPTRRGGIPPFAVPDGFGLEAADISFLQGAGASVEDVSAGALVRQQQDRPVDDLPPSLRRLRERSRQAEEAAAAAEASMERDSLSEMLPGVDIGLAPVKFTGGANVERTIALTADQTTRAALLASIAGTAPERPRISAIEMTYDSPFMEDLADDEENIVHPPATAAVPAATPRRRARRRVRIQPDRLLVGLLLALAVIAPFVLRDVRVGDPPPASFEAGSPGARAFTALNGLGRGDLVLVGLEYAPASAGELDGMTDALLRHIVLRGAIPVVVSGSPLALLRAESRFEALNADAALLARIESRQPLERGTEYHIGRLLAGGLIGVRALSAAPELLTADINSTTEGLGIRGLDDFALVVLIADNGEAARDYAEQIAPFARAPFVAAVSYSAAPLAGAYLGADVFDALLAGYADALTYSARLADVTPISRRIRIVRTPAPVIAPPTSAPDAPPEAAIAPEATDESGAPIVGESTPEATASPTPARLTAVVNAGQRVNMRAAPSSTAQVITGVDPGTRLTLLGSSADGAWANVELADGRQGWISASLLRIVTGAPKVRPVRAPREQDADFPPTNTRPPTRAVTAMPTRTPVPPSATPTRTPMPPSATSTPVLESTSTLTQAESAGAEPTDVATATLIPSDTPTASSTPAPTLTPTTDATSTPAPPPPTREPLVFSEGLQGERWYGINLGIIMSVLIISGGAIFNIIRALLRRR
jgi:hypothetical protein